MNSYLEDFSVYELKMIVRDIINSEIEGNDVKFDIFPVTILEYYNDYLMSRSFKKLERVGFSAVPLRFKGGFRINSLNNIVIFLHHPKKNVKPRKSFFDLVLNSYHEARHINQDSLDKYSYEGSLIDMENYISSWCRVISYVLEHDNYFVEIDARMYSISKAISYLKSNYSIIYEKSKGYISKLNREYTFYSLTYDIVSVIEKTIEVRMKRYRSVSSMINNPIFLDMYLSEEVPAILDVFLNWNCTFKSVAQIIAEVKEKKVDERIVYAFLSCKYFLESVDMNNLSLEEQDVILKALEYMNSVYKNQFVLVENAYNDKSISIVQFLKMKNNIMSRIEFLDKYLNYEFKGRER